MLVQETFIDSRVILKDFRKFQVRTASQAVLTLLNHEEPKFTKAEKDEGYLF